MLLRLALQGVSNLPGAIESGSTARIHRSQCRKQGAKHFGRVTDSIFFYTTGSAIRGINSIVPTIKPTSIATIVEWSR